MKTEKYSSDYIHKLINQNNITKALELLNHNSDNSIWAQNTRAVCFMRTNSPKSAIKLLTPIVYLKNSVIMDYRTPEKIKLNLAAAMLLDGNIAGAINIIDTCNETSDYREKLVKSIKQWRKSLPIWWRFMTILGLFPYNKPVQLDEPYGEL